MAKVLVVYFSHGGNTRKMGECIAKALSESGVEVTLKKLAEADPREMADHDGVLLGSPCYFGSMAAEMKSFLDRSIVVYGKGELKGKAAGAFASSGVIGGLGEFTIMGLLNGLLIHGMVIQGVHKAGHLAPLAIGEPDERALKECADYGRQFAGLVKRLGA